MGVQTWCPIESKPRAYVLANSLTRSGSGKHQSDVDYHVIKKWTWYYRCFGVGWGQCLYPKGKSKRPFSSQRQNFWKGDVFCRMLPTCTKNYAEKNVPGRVWGQGWHEQPVCFSYSIKYLGTIISVQANTRLFIFLLVFKVKRHPFLRH